jgi:DNA-binding CsgD family transcriptional regulator
VPTSTGYLRVYEVDTLRALARGDRIPEIAHAQGRSYGTVRRRVGKLLEATGTCNHASLVWWAVSTHVIPPPRGKMSDRFTLPARQLQVVELIAHGCTHAQVGRQLYLDAATVRTYLERSRKTASARTTAHLIALCWKFDLLVEAQLSPPVYLKPLPVQWYDGRSGSRWTASERRWLLRNWDLSISVQAKHLKRSYASVHHQRSDMIARGLAAPGKPGTRRKEIRDAQDQRWARRHRDQGDV